MVRKLRMFDPENREALAAMLAETNPARIKAHGRRVRHYDEAQWSAVRYGAMLDGLMLKFTQNAPLRALLLGTGDALIAEASPRDAVWGIGLSEAQARGRAPSTWTGRNLLGLGLMEVRARCSLRELGRSPQ